jgi:hypothetical protein
MSIKRHLAATQRALWVDAVYVNSRFEPMVTGDAQRRHLDV